MGKGTNCKSETHQVFKDGSKSRMEDLKVMITDLHCTRKGNRGNDLALWEEELCHEEVDATSGLAAPKPDTHEHKTC
ncbi:hypothetical protein R6Q59_001492 [Mikania micrantha]|uniref:Uncharacterized protein n=1 Tax=Mikania micrantha TaxID=192012 RepID=A0A5N6NM32_9ASTR|nr:hypothetical protein E3N88_18436 [Mikania micrantha]